MQRRSPTRFSPLRDSGIVAATTRFQVSLPTPWASVRACDREEVFRAYRARFLADLGDLLDHISHEDLAIQWDVAVEIAELEGALEDGREEPLENVTGKLADLVPRISSAVETGFHFCYGDAGHVHFVQPRDLRTIVALVNGLGRHLDRRLSWVHMPVPQERSDDAYFAALADLDTNQVDRVHLGLLHLSDGVEGRCGGWRRRPPGSRTSGWRRSADGVERIGRRRRPCSSCMLPPPGTDVSARYDDPADMCSRSFSSARWASGT